MSDHVQPIEVVEQPAQAVPVVTIFRDPKTGAYWLGLYDQSLSKRKVERIMLNSLTNFVNQGDPDKEDEPKSRLVLPPLNGMRGGG